MASSKKKTPEVPSPGVPTPVTDTAATGPGASTGPGAPVPLPLPAGAQDGATEGKDEGNKGEVDSPSSPSVSPEGTEEEKQEGDPPSDSPAPTPSPAPSTTPNPAPPKAPTTPQVAHEGNDVVLRAEHEALLADLEERDAQIAQLQQENADLRATNADLRAQVQEANEVLAVTRREHTQALDALKALENATEEPKTRGPALQAWESGPASSSPPLKASAPPPGHVRMRVKRGSVVLSVGTRREADGVFDIPAWEVAGLDDVVEILARG